MESSQNISTLSYLPVITQKKQSKQTMDWFSSTNYYMSSTSGAQHSISKGGPSLLKVLGLETEEDNASQSSTIPRDDGTMMEGKPYPSVHHDDNLGRMKQVRFDEGRNQTYLPTPDLQTVNLRDFWYSMTDFKKFKASMKRVALEIRQQEEEQQADTNRNDETSSFSYQRALEQCYQACQHVRRTGSASQGSTSTDEIASIRQTEERPCLLDWAQMAPNRVGLERIIALSIDKDVRARRDKLVDVLDDLQNDFDYWGGDNIDADAKAEILRQASLHLTRTSCLFALYLGQASERVAVY